MKKDNLPENPEQQETHLEAGQEQRTAAETAPEEKQPETKADNAGEAKEAPADAIGMDEQEPEPFLEEEAPGEQDESGGSASGKKKSKKKRDNRRFRFGTMATVLTAAAVAVVVLFNVVVGILADRFPLNLDLTKDKTYSLSDTSLEIIKSVDKDVQILIFADEELFRDNVSAGEQGKILRQFYEALNSCVSLSGGKITVRYVDTTDPAATAPYEDYDISAGDVLLICGDRHQKFVGYNYYTYSSELWEAQTNSYYETSYTSVVEKTLMTRLNNVTSDQNLVMTMFVGHGEDESTVSGLKSIYEANGYDIKEVDLSTATEIDENTSIAVIPAPTKDYSKDELQRLREWMDEDGLKGQNLLVMINYSADCPELYGYLKEYYGIEVTDNLIQETDTSKMVRIGMSLNPYYSYADIEDNELIEGLTDGKVIMGPTRQLLTHWGTDSQNTSKLNYDLLTYSDTAKLITLKDANDEERDEDADPTFKAEEYPVVGVAHAQTYSYDGSDKVTNNVVVCGGMWLANSTFLQNASFNNEDVLLSVANNLTGNDAIVISGKSVKTDTMTLTESTVWTLMIIFVVVIPVVTLVICLVVFIKRRHL